jgi:ATP-dependent protease ClpP protease subunit
MCLGDKPLNVRINSYGGSLFAGHAMMSALKRYPGKVTAYVDGIAASAATLVAMGADRVVMPSNAMMMIHNPAFSVSGVFEQKDLEKMGGSLAEMKKASIAAYQTKTKLSAEAIAEIMDEETWMTAAAAKEYGFADEVRGEVKFELEKNNLVANGLSVPLNCLPGGAQIVNLVKNNGQEAEKKVNDKEKSLFNAVRDFFGASEAAQNAAGKEPLTLAALKADYPDLYREAKSEGAKAERERLKAIDDIAGALPRELVNKAKFESGQTAAELALLAARDAAEAGRAFMAAAKTDAADAGADAVAAGAGAAPLNEGEERANLVNLMVRSFGGAE